MAMIKSGSRYTYVRRTRPDGSTVLECYHDGCTNLRTGTYARHNGAHEPACDEHSGRCHPNCWPDHPAGQDEAVTAV
jgi:hypothetical protein